MKRLAALLMLCSCALAQHHHGPSAETEKSIDLAKLPAPQRIKGIGSSHIPITSKSPEAQQWFDQGLALMHCFWDYEALRAFEESLRKDPNCAICHWGLYRALEFSDKDEQAKQELDK